MFITFILITSLAIGMATPPSKIDNLPKTMKAVGLYKYLPISDAESLLDLEVSLPNLENDDVLIEVKATAANLIDAILRALKPTVEKSPRILGMDGAGVVVAKGNNSKVFNIGDDVFFAGYFTRNGSNAQYVAVNEILVGPKPKNLSFDEAAAMPVTAITAYESIYDRLLISEKDKDKSILIINSGGGVGSVACQIVKNLGLKVIGTASRDETQAFSFQNGADIVLNHTQDLISQLKTHGYEKGVDYILVNYDPFPYWETLMKAIKPQGRICLIVDSSDLVDIRPLKDKSVTLVSEMMLTKIKYDTEDKFRYHEILQEVSKMLDSGMLKTTLTKTLKPVNAVNLREAHKIMEEKRMVGKLVLSGFIN